MSDDATDDGMTKPKPNAVLRGADASTIDPSLAPSNPLHSTEHGLSDLLNQAGSGRFGRSELTAILNFALFGLACAWWLASRSTWFASTLPPDVVGLLSERGLDKGFETRLFVFATFAIPAFAWAIARTLRAQRFARDRLGSPSSWFASFVATAVTMVYWATSADELSSFGWVTVAAAVSIGPLGAWLESRQARAAAHATSRAHRFDSGFMHGLDRWSVPGADLVLGAACVTVALLALGPRTLPDASLLDGILRIAGVFLGAGIALLGFCGLLAPGRGRCALTLARPFVLLAGVRFFRGDPAVQAAAILGGIAAAWAIASAWRMRRDPADGAHASAPPTRAQFAWNVAAPFLVLTLVFHFGVHGGLDLFHSGEWLTIGALTRDGWVPFRDLYLQHGLVQNALRSAWTMEWIGDSLWADRVTTNALYGLTHAAFLWMLLPVLRSPYVALLVALGFATRGLYLQPRFIPLFVAVACLLRAIELSHRDDARPDRRPIRRRVAIAGAAAGVGVFWSLDIGVYTSLAALAYFALAAWFERASSSFVRRFVAAALPFALGAAAGAAPFFAYLASHGALTAFVENSVQQVALQLPVWGLPFPSFREWFASAREGDPKTFLGDGTFVAFVAPLVFVATAAAVLVRSTVAALGPRDLQRLLLAIFGLVVYRTALGRSDAGHFAYAAALLWPLALMFAEDAWRARRVRSVLARAAPACILIGFVFTAFEPGYALVRQWTRISEFEPEVPGGGFSYAPLPRMRDVLVPDVQAQTLTALKAWLDERMPPAEPLVDFCNAGAAYYFVERPIASRYAYPAYAATPAMQAELIADLDRVAPRYLLASQIIGAMHLDGVNLERRLPMLAAYFKANYEPCAEEVFGTMLRRKVPR